MSSKGLRVVFKLLAILSIFILNTDSYALLPKKKNGGAGMVIDAASQTEEISDEPEAVEEDESSTEDVNYEEESSDETEATENNETEPSEVGQGKFTVVYDQATGPTAELAKVFVKTRPYDELMTGLGSVIKLPNNIQVRFTRCGVVNAFYDPSSMTIYMCYELIEDLKRLLGKDGELKGDKLGEAAIQATTFILVHEMAHCLIHILGLPVIGGEEQAADSLAGILFIGKADEIVEQAIITFASFADEEEISTETYFDEHPLNQQRVGNIACLLYGSNPSKYPNMVPDLLPAARAERCADEYKQADDSWEKLLGPHIS